MSQHQGYGEADFKPPPPQPSADSAEKRQGQIYGQQHSVVSR